MNRGWSKQCPVCGKKAGKSSELCEVCRVPLVPVDESASGDVAVLTDASLGADPSGVADSEGVFDDDARNPAEPPETPEDDAVPAKVDAFVDAPILDEKGETTPASTKPTVYRFVGIDGPHKGDSFEAHAGRPIIVGRQGHADICLDRDESVSRTHASLDVRDGKLEVHDLGSTNGTFKSVKPTDEWEDDDKALFGKTTFRVTRAD